MVEIRRGMVPTLRRTMVAIISPMLFGFDERIMTIMPPANRTCELMLAFAWRVVESF
jgi:hypothetical protein